MKGNRFKNCKCYGLYRKKYDENKPKDAISFINVLKALKQTKADLRQGECHTDKLGRTPACIPTREAVYYFGEFIQMHANFQSKYYDSYKFKWNITLEYLKELADGE